MHSTAICCAVRTALSGATTDPDLSCELQQSPEIKPNRADSTRGRHNKRRLETVSQIHPSHLSTEFELTIPRPEVNIGIVCANAPVLRPLYLFYRGRLASQQRSSTGGVSKQSMWPGNTPQAAISPIRRGESNDTSVGDTTVSLEMGLHPHDSTQPQSPLKEQTFFITDGGR